MPSSIPAGRRSAACKSALSCSVTTRTVSRRTTGLRMKSRRWDPRSLMMPGTISYPCPKIRPRHSWRTTPGSRDRFSIASRLIGPFQLLRSRMPAGSPGRSSTRRLANRSRGASGGPDHRIQRPPGRRLEQQCLRLRGALRGRRAGTGRLQPLVSRAAERAEIHCAWRSRACESRLARTPRPT